MIYVLLHNLSTYYLKKKTLIHLVKMHLATSYFYNNYVIAYSVIL